MGKMGKPGFEILTLLLPFAFCPEQVCDPIDLRDPS